MTSSAPTTQAAQSDSDNEHLGSLVEELVTVDESIDAINRTLRVTGYWATVAGDKKEDVENGTDLMLRNGGGPVSWREFYGQTARDFESRDTTIDVYKSPRVSNVYASSVYSHQLRTPPQFQAIFQANANAAAKYQKTVDAMGKKTEELMARRRQLESEQSSLWARVTFEVIAGREIPLRLLYRNQLAIDETRPGEQKAGPARIEAIYALIRFLRAADTGVADIADSIKTDQAGSLSRLRETLKAASEKLAESVLDFEQSDGVTDDDFNRVKDLSKLARRMYGETQDMCESYQKANEGDSASDQKQKLSARGKLQQSLLRFSVALGTMDYCVTTLAEQWGIRPEKGKMLAIPKEQPATAPAGPVAMPAPTGALGPVPAAAVTVDAQNKRHIDLFKLIDPVKDSASGTWSFRNGKLTCTPSRDASIEIPYVPPDDYDYRIQFVVEHVVDHVSAICAMRSHNFFAGVSYMGNKESWIGPQHDGQKLRLLDGQKYLMVIKVRKSHLELYVDDKLISSREFNFAVLHKKGIRFRPFARTDTIGIEANLQAVSFEALEVVELAGEGKSVSRP